MLKNPLKTAYERGFEDGLRSRQRIITFNDEYQFRMKNNHELPKEDIHNIKTLLQDSRSKSMDKWMLYEAMSYYEIARDQPSERKNVFDEIGKFAENCVQSWEIMRTGDYKPVTNEWDG